MKTGWHFVLVLLVALVPASAQLLVGSLKPAGGETFAVGATMTIEWSATKAQDGRYDIYYSKDGGATYPVELAGPWQGSKVDNAKNIYLWKIPENLVSSQMRIRICQLSGGHCVQPGVYMMDSPANFTITAATGLSGQKPAGAAASRLDFFEDGKNLGVAFSLSEAGAVSLKAFDLAGNCVATVANGHLGAGEHRLPVFPDRMDAAGPLLFKLEVSGQMASGQKGARQEAITRIWSGR